MEEMLAKFAKIPQPQKIGILVGLVLLMLVTHYFLVYRSQQNETKSLRDQLQQEESRWVEKEAVARDLPRFQREVERMQQQLKEAMQHLPEKSEMPELLRKVSDLAEKAGLQTERFEPFPEVPQDFYVEVPVSVKITGTYHDILTFFHTVSKLSRIVNMTQVEMLEPKVKSNKVIVDSSCRATTFRFLTDEERKTLQAAQKPGRAARGGGGGVEGVE